MTENIIKIIYMVATIIIIILSIGSYIYTQWKSKKIKKAIEANDTARANELETARNPFKDVLKIIESYLPNIIEVAEQSANNGIAKKFIAMSQLMLKCNDVGINFKDYEAELSQLIDDFVAMSKKVNIGALTLTNDTCCCEPLTKEEVEGVINNV